MLVLSRKQGEAIRIGDDVLVMVTKIEGGSVRLGIKAPDDVRVDREEIYEKRIKEFKCDPEEETQGCLWDED